MPQPVSTLDPNATSPLNPTLRVALSSLDVELEQELARYRRRRRLQRKLEKDPRFQAMVADALPQVNQAEIHLPSPWDDDMGTGESTSDRQSRLSAVAPSVMPQPTMPQSTGSEIVPAPKPAESAETSSAIAPRSANPVEKPPKPDYYASSEELLRSLAEEVELEEENPDDWSLEPETHWLSTLLTPLGIGSMLLLFLASATLGFLIINPSILNWPGRESDPSESSTDPAATSQREVSPNLADQEFIDLDLDTLSTLPTNRRSPQSLPSAPNSETDPTDATPTVDQYVNESESEAIAASPAPSESASAPAIISPVEPIADPAPVYVEPEPWYEPEAAYVPPAPAPAPPPPVEAAPPVAPPSPVAVNSGAIDATPPSENYVYVITDYTGDGSLNSAQSAVGDAYVRNFPDGAQVQLGAFSSESGAEELIESLEAQGISAEVYRP